MKKLLWIFAVILPFVLSSCNPNVSDSTDTNGYYQGKMTIRTTSESLSRSLKDKYKKEFNENDRISVFVYQTHESEEEENVAYNTIIEYDGTSWNEIDGQNSHLNWTGHEGAYRFIAIYPAITSDNGLSIDENHNIRFNLGELRKKDSNYQVFSATKEMDAPVGKNEPPAVELSFNPQLGGIHTAKSEALNATIMAYETFTFNVSKGSFSLIEEGDKSKLEFSNGPDYCSPWIFPQKVEITFEGGSNEVTIEEGDIIEISGLVLAADDYYEIYDESGLRTWSELGYWKKNSARLMADITLPERLSGKTYCWTPVGTTDSPFTKDFDGNGHSIIKLQINGRTEAYQGMFGCISGGNVKNLTLKEVSICSGEHTSGAIVGKAENSSIENCHVDSGTISSSYPGVGGIAGYSVSSTISDCTVSATVKSSSSEKSVTAGGIAGTCESSQIIHCALNQGASVIGTAGVGGIAGESKKESKIIACSANGTITRENCNSANGVGGIVGINYANIVACSSYGSIEGYGDYCGGIAGDCLNDSYIVASASSSSISTETQSSLIGGISGKSVSLSTISNCYWTNVEKGVADNSGEANHIFKVGGTDQKTWIDATSDMNNAIVTWNNSFANECVYHFEQTNGSNNPPVVIKGVPSPVT